MDKVVELVGGGSVINGGPTPSSYLREGIGGGGHSRQLYSRLNYIRNRELCGDSSEFRPAECPLMFSGLV